MVGTLRQLYIPRPKPTSVCSVKKVYFGGAHDNGYTTHLNMIQNEGYLHKVVILQSYTQLAAEIKALGLPCLQNHDIFLSEKLSAKSMNARAGAVNGVVPDMTRSEQGTSVPELRPTPITTGGGIDFRAAVVVLKVYFRSSVCLIYMY